MRMPSLRWASALFALALIVEPFPALAAGRVGTTWSDSFRFFFHVEGGNYAGCPQSRFVLDITDKTRQAMVLSARASGQVVTVDPGACANDGDTSVFVLYVHGP